MALRIIDTHRISWEDVVPIGSLTDCEALIPIHVVGNGTNNYARSLEASGKQQSSVRRFCYFLRAISNNMIWLLSIWAFPIHGGQISVWFMENPRSWWGCVCWGDPTISGKPHLYPSLSISAILKPWRNGPSAPVMPQEPRLIFCCSWASTCSTPGFRTWEIHSEFSHLEKNLPFHGSRYRPL